MLAASSLDAARAASASSMSVRRVEDITEALWGTRVTSPTGSR
jgi:hypothetical protein